jgi:hypothetical protein
MVNVPRLSNKEKIDKEKAQVNCMVKTAKGIRGK